MNEILRKPDWLRAKLPASNDYMVTRRNVDGHGLHTVCQSAQCPNMGECWTRGSATVMILGNVCTRACSFCAVLTGRPSELDLGEPPRVADAISKMGLRHVVVTSVARDDLTDGGASVWAAVVRLTRSKCPEMTIEVLPADFRGVQEHLDILLDAHPDILNHNLETVERLQRPIRKTARYDRSFWVLKHAKQRGFITKTGIMLGIGEKREEIAQLIRDIRDAGVNILTIGQYLAPSKQHAPIDRWVHPDEFAEWKDYALSIGIDICESGPLVRSSYRSERAASHFNLLERRKLWEPQVSDDAVDATAACEK
ncbi:MAG: lipoyl synthase [Puniceicoccales bacterium]|jgi:lipoic acid synthetase|nr:lipoyl synthase [Puniceicoccales bacterium]